MCKLNEAGYMVGVNLFVFMEEGKIDFHVNVGIEDESHDFIREEIIRGLKAIGYLGSYKSNGALIKRMRTIQVDIEKEVLDEIENEISTGNTTVNEIPDTLGEIPR